MPKNIRLEQWCAAAPADAIGIRYRVVRVALGHRSVMAYNRRSLWHACRAAIRATDELLEVCPGDEADPVKPLTDAMGLRVHVGGEPVDFVIEEDTCEDEEGY